MNREPIPRLPVFGWQAFGGDRDAAVPCLLESKILHYSTSGRAAILLALETLGIGPGDTVLLPTYHCPTMVAPAANLGANVAFYPLDEHGAPQLQWLEQQDLGNVRALLAAHFFGLPQPMAHLRAWCTQRGIALVEDCAHALFGRSGERPIGAWGDLAIASLTKFLPVPEGGCLIVNPGLAEAARVPSLRPCGMVQQARAAVDIAEVGASQDRLTGLNHLIAGTLGGLRILRGASQPGPLQPTPGNGHSGFNTPSPRGMLTVADLSINSQLAHRQLSRVSRWVARRLPRARIVQQRRSNYELLARHLAGHAGMHPLRPQLPADCAPYVFPLWVQAPDPGYSQLRELQMPVFRWDRLWPDVPKLPGDYGIQWSHHMLQLACHQDLSERDLHRFIAALLKLYAHAPATTQRRPVLSTP